MFTAVAAFAAGCASGALAAWMAVKDKYSRMAEEEIASMRDYVAGKTHEADPEKEDDSTDETGFDMEDWESYISTIEPYHEKTVEERDASEPRIVDESEFGEMDDYSVVCLTYFKDGTVGRDALDAMERGVRGDLIFVRNDRLACDFEVAADVRRYRDVLEDRARP